VLSVRHWESLVFVWGLEHGELRALACNEGLSALVEYRGQNLTGANGKHEHNYNFKHEYVFCLKFVVVCPLCVGKLQLHVLVPYMFLPMTLLLPLLYAG